MKRIYNILVVFFILGLASCNKNAEVMSSLTDKDYENYASTLRDDLNLLGDALRCDFTSFVDTFAIEECASNIYSDNTKKLSAFLDNYQVSLKVNKSVDITNIDSVIMTIINDIDVSLNASDDCDGFIQLLDQYFENIYYSNISNDNKERLLLYVTSYKVAVQFVKDNNDLLSSNMKSATAIESLWWNRWGRCVAGVIGGAGTGALTFGLGGAAVGTIALPIVGTVSAGTVGAIGGAIAGGLTGAATFCASPANATGVPGTGLTPVIE